MDHTCLGKTVPQFQSLEIGPREGFAPTTPGQPSFPDLSRSQEEVLETGNVTDDPVVPVVALQLLLQRLVLNRERSMPIDSTPIRQRLKRSLEAAPGRLALITHPPFRARPQ